MNTEPENGRVEVELNGERLTLDYVISQLRESEFNLTVWYCGVPLRERVRQYSFDSHEDVGPHARRLVEKRLAIEVDGRDG